MKHSATPALAPETAPLVVAVDVQPAMPQPHPLTGLEQPLAELERGLAALSDALRERDPSRIEAASAGLHRALAKAAQPLARSVRERPLPPTLQRRLMHASVQVRAQREALVRATASVDRALHLLLPAPAATTYAAGGVAERPQHSGSTMA